MIAKIKNWFSPKKDVRFIPSRPNGNTWTDLYKFHFSQLQDVEKSLLATERVFNEHEADQIRFFEQYRK